jgi:hypothetical protein
MAIQGVNKESVVADHAPLMSSIYTQRERERVSTCMVLKGAARASFIWSKPLCLNYTTYYHLDESTEAETTGTLLLTIVCVTSHCVGWLWFVCLFVCFPSENAGFGLCEKGTCNLAAMEQHLLARD